jgi:hypothetical protein
MRRIESSVWIQRWALAADRARRDAQPLEQQAEVDAGPVDVAVACEVARHQLEAAAKRCAGRGRRARPSAPSVRATTRCSST